MSSRFVFGPAANEVKCTPDIACGCAWRSSVPDGFINPRAVRQEWTAIDA